MTDAVAAPIIDAHCHVPDHNFFPRTFIEGAIENMVGRMPGTPEQARRYAESMILGQFDDPMCDKLVADMNEAHIDKAILIVPDFTHADRSCALSLDEMIERVDEIRRRHRHRFEAFVGVDPRWGKDGVALFERALDTFGFSGLKVYPPCGVNPSDPTMDPFYEICAAHRAPVLVHQGGSCPTLSFIHAHPLAVDDAARRFASVPFILAHAGTTHTESSTMLATFRPNVYLEVSGFQAHHAAPLGLLTDKGIGNKLIFGTDWPIFGSYGSLRDTIASLNTDDGPISALSDLEIAGFFGATADRLINQCSTSCAERVAPGESTPGENDTARELADLLATVTDCGVDEFLADLDKPLRSLDIESVQLMAFFARVEERYAPQWDENTSPDALRSLAAVARFIREDRSS